MYVVQIITDNEPIYIANTAMDFDGYQTLPFLEKVSQLTRVVNWAGTIENSSITIDLIDNPTLRESLSINDVLGCTLKLYYFTDLLGTFRICEFPRSSNNRLKIKADVFSIFSSAISPVLGVGQFDNCLAKTKGETGNIIYGSLQGSFIEAHRVWGDKYLASWGPLSNITEIYDSEGNDITSQCAFSIDPETGYTYIEYDSTDYSIQFKCYGPTESDILVENPARMLQRIIERYSTNITIDEQSFNTAYDVFEERKYNGNCIVVNSDWNWVDLFGEFGKSFDCIVSIKRNGAIALKVLSWGDESPVITVHPTNLKDFICYLETKEVKRRWKRKFKFNWVSRTFQEVQHDIQVENKLENKGKAEQVFLVVDLASHDVTSRKAFLHSKPTYMYECGVPPETARLVELGDTFLIKHWKNPQGNEYKLVQLMKENRGKGPFATIEVADISEIIQGVFILYDEGHPDVAELGDTTGPTLL